MAAVVAVAAATDAMRGLARHALLLVLLACAGCTAVSERPRFVEPASSGGSDGGGGGAGGGGGSM
jgi:hypothetical protein